MDAIETLVFAACGKYNACMVLPIVLGLLLALAMGFWALDRRWLLHRLRTMRDHGRKDQDFRDLMDREVMHMHLDSNGTILYASHAFCKFTGHQDGELNGKLFQQVLMPEELPESYKDLWNSLARNFGWRDDISGFRKNGKQYWAEVSVTPLQTAELKQEGFSVVFHDITDRKLVEELSITDELTGLYNRRHFNRIMSRELLRARRAKETIVLAMLDVDHFKRYNDTYGHQQGDQVLAAIGHVMKDMLRRPTDFCFRLGGEEFGIVITDLNAEKGIGYLERIRQSIMDSAIEHIHNEEWKVVTISIGALKILAPDPAKNADYYRLADDLLYQAKASGRNKMVVAEG